ESVFGGPAAPSEVPATPPHVEAAGPIDCRPDASPSSEAAPVTENRAATDWETGPDADDAPEGGGPRIGREPNEFGRSPKEPQRPWIRLPPPKHDRRRGPR